MMMNKEIILIRAPSILGLRSSGVELLPDALEEAGLARRLGIREIRTVVPPRYDPERDQETGMLNPHGIAEYSVRLANAVEEVVRRGGFPLVLGGDCSIIIGNMLALKRGGRYGLFFLDGHADFYQPAASPSGEAADMDLALVSGRGPDIVVDLEGQKPLVRDEDIVLFGQRDREESLEYGSRQVAETPIHVFELEKIKKDGLQRSLKTALEQLFTKPLRGFWVHVDADVLNDNEMPAVDYRMPDGLHFEELSAVLTTLLSSGKVVGMGVSIYNPRLDPSKAIARELVESLAAGFNGVRAR
jgi:arginase